MSEFLISIIIPVYNGESYLKSRFENLLTNNLENIELLIVDDGSTDSTPEICRDMLSNISNAKIISQDNQGLSGARNTGLQFANGEYILFLDSDDILISNGLKAIKQCLSTVNVDVLMGKYVLISENGKKFYPSYDFPKALTPNDARTSIYSQIPDSIWNVWRYICKRDFLSSNDLLFAYGLVCEDMEWTPRMLNVACSISFCDEPFYGYYFNRPGSITRTSTEKRVQDVNQILIDTLPKYISENYGMFIAHRLIHESFCSISRYCLCRSNKRKELRPLINQAISFYHLSPSRVVRLFLLFHNFVPLFLLSLGLNFIRTVRNFFKSFIGPISASLKNYEKK